MGSGFTFFTNAIDKTPGTTNSWQDVDCSANIPSGSTGVILKIVNTSSTVGDRAEVRKNGSSDDIGLIIVTQYTRYAFVGVDENRIFEAYIANTAFKIYLIGYTDENVGFFTSAIDKTPGTTGSWQDVDVGGDGVPSGATGVICLLYNSSGSTAYYGGVRKNGSTSEVSYGRLAAGSRFVYQLCGVDANRIFEARISNAAFKVVLVGYTKNPVTFFDNPINKSLTQTNQWTDIDITGDTDPTADGAILLLRNESTTLYLEGDVRKNGSSDDTTDYSWFGNTEVRGAATGVDANQIFEGWISNTAIDFYLIGYCKPSVILKEVTDSVGLADALKRDKTFTIADVSALADVTLLNKTLAISDSVGASDVALGNKAPLIVSDSVSLADLVNVIAGAITKTVLDSVGLADQALANKSVVIADAVNLLDVIFRHKPSVTVPDVIGIAEAVLAAKLLAVGDSVNLTDVARVLKTLNVSDALMLVDAVSAPSRVLQTLDSVGLADNIIVNKVLQIAETMSLVEIIQVGVGGAKKTKLFLILGDMAVQLTGE